MRVLVFGANGFVGRALSSELEKRHEVFSATRSSITGDHNLTVDLEDIETVKSAVEASKPEVVVNAAGVVDNNEQAALNITFTKNILDAIIATGRADSTKYVMCGSAAEYGNVNPDDIPVDEDCETNPTSLYGRSKHEEVEYAKRFCHTNGIKLVVARIFNPIGNGMASKFIIPRLMEQLGKIDVRIGGSIEISRKDSIRDYIDVRDLARGIVCLVEHTTEHEVYNIGSGVGTSNETLVSDLATIMLRSSSVEILETQPEPEKPVASQADISRMRTEFHWQPKIELTDTLMEIAHE